jgi:dUTP pyrophosphatase
MYIKIAKIKDAKTPARANPGDALDFYIPNDFNNGYPYIIEPGDSVLIPGGIKVEVPYGYALQLLNKSGVASKKSLVVGACLVDHGYAGEVHYDIHNIGKHSQIVTAGDKIVQGVIIQVFTPSVQVVQEDELYKEIAVVSSRGEGGFGSTGTK